MTLVEWAHVVLPLLALGWILCLIAIYPEAIDAGVEKFEEWWARYVHNTKA